MKVGARLVRGSESPSRTDKRRQILKSLGQATEPGSLGGWGAGPTCCQGRLWRLKARAVGSCIQEPCARNEGLLHSASDLHPRESFSHRWVCTTGRGRSAPITRSGTSVGPGVGDSLSLVLRHPIRSSETGGDPFKDTELFVPKRVTSAKIITERFS